MLTFGARWRISSVTARVAAPASHSSKATRPSTSTSPSQSSAVSRLGCARTRSYPNPARGRLDDMTDHVKIRVPDVEAARRFYGRAIELVDGPQPVEDDWGDFSLAEAGEGEPLTRRLHVAGIDAVLRSHRPVGQAPGRALRRPHPGPRRRGNVRAPGRPTRRSIFISPLQPTARTWSPGFTMPASPPATPPMERPARDPSTTRAFTAPFCSTPIVHYKQ